jgi:hypothetical protein
MGSLVKLALSGRVGLPDILGCVQQVKHAEDCTSVELLMHNIESLDLSGIQLITGLQERYGSSFHLEIDSINTELKALLSNAGVYEIIKISSN